MSRTATEALIVSYFAALNSGDTAAVLALLHEDVVHDINQGAREIGRDKFRWFLATAGAHFEERATDIVVMSSPDGMRGAAEYTLKGAYIASLAGLPKANGQRYALTVGTFFEVDEGRITRVSTLFNRADWLAQIGEE
ncbi:MAG: SnoaL-like domain-containing protein [Phyllobacteriaceae bacterium]|nr:SnoaL-like domain-containing protein [Phyllobacteriaceae bacterium]